MDNSKNIPIYEINRENIESEWTNLLESIKTSSFVSIDIEMSGLGNRKKLNAASIEDRYKNIKETASTYSILSIGISCFQIDASQKKTNKTFNISTLCSSSFLTEPTAIKFLIEHGLDLNAHFLKAIPYHRGENRKTNDSDKEYLKELLIEISRLLVPIVLHNGFIDLIFIYQNFYDNLPENVMDFAANLSELFPGGLYDTKYLADFHARPNASYLEYLYYKALHESKNSNQFDLQFEKDPEFRLKSIEISIEGHKPDDIKTLEKQICQQYSLYGYCSSKNLDGKCAQTHQIQSILKLEVLKKEKHRLKSAAKKSGSEREVVIEPSEEPEKPHDSMSKNLHNAGFDSFMTGFVMLYYIRKFSQFKAKSNTTTTTTISLNDFADFDRFASNIYLTGKDYPFMVKKSLYSSATVKHQNKKIKIDTD